MSKLSDYVKQKLDDYDWLYDQYIIMKKNTFQIGKEIGCSNCTVLRYLKSNNILIRDNSEAQGIPKELLIILNDRNWLYNQYIIQNKSTHQLGEELKCSCSTINNYIKKHNIRIKNGGESRGISTNSLDMLNNYDWLYDQYVTMKKGTVQIGKELGCSYTTINSYIKKHNIQINHSYSRSYGENQVFEFVRNHCPDVIQSYKIPYRKSI